jgi:hypothetical protein
MENQDLHREMLSSINAENCIPPDLNPEEWFSNLESADDFLTETEKNFKPQ